MHIYSSLIFVIKTGNNNTSRIMRYSFLGYKCRMLQIEDGLWPIKSLHATFATFNGSSVEKWSKPSSLQPWNISTLFKRAEGDILGVADLKSNSAVITVATKNRILLVEGGEVYAEFSIPEPPKDVFSIDEETLMVFDASGFLKINLHTKKSVRIVPQIKTLDSLASWIGGYFFALDIANKSLYLFGSDMAKVRQVWSLGNQLRDGDELQHLCVSRTMCLCSTKYGFVLHFDIKFDKKQ